MQEMVQKGQVDQELRQQLLKFWLEQEAGTGGPEGAEEVSLRKRGGQADGSDQSQLLVYG